jgi:hypothetical protein
MPDAQLQPIPVRKPRSRTRRALHGVGVTLALLGGLEVALLVIAHAELGEVSPAAKLIARALSLGVGAVVAGLRGGGTALLLVAAVSMSAHAADRYRSYSVTLASAACPTGAPGLMSDGKEPGLSVGGLRSWNVTVCPESTRTFTGAGLLRVCVFRRSPGGPNLWTLSPTFYWDFADDGSGNPITSTSSNRCVTFSDVLLGVNDGDLVYVYPETTLGVSAGATVSVYLEGQLNATP